MENSGETEGLEEVIEKWNEQELNHYKRVKRALEEYLEKELKWWRVILRFFSRKKEIKKTVIIGVELYYKRRETQKEFWLKELEVIRQNYEPYASSKE